MRTSDRLSRTIERLASQTGTRESIKRHAGPRGTFSIVR